MSDLTLYIDNDNRIKLVGLADADNTYQNSATVQVTLKDDQGNNLAGQTWPLALSYVAASNGDYKEVLQDTISGLTNGDDITAVVDVESGGLTAHWEIPVKAGTRTA